MIPAKSPTGVLPPLIDDYAPFSVLQYNMLSNSDSSNHSLDWRGQAITDFLLQHNADVLCLQEVYADWFQNFLQPKLGKAGYKGYYTPRGEQMRFHTLRPGDRPDGCAIFYKTDRFIGRDFEAQQYRHALFEKGQRRFGTSDVFAQRMLGPGHVIQVALLDLIPTKETYNSAGFLNKPKKRSLVVGNTKLLTPRTEDVSFMQAYLAMRIMKNFMSQRLGIHRKSRQRDRDDQADFAELLDSVGVVFAGDLNRYPDEKLYDFFSKGRLDTDIVANAFGRKVPDRPLTHEFRGLNSAYKTALGSEPIVTTRTGCLDYIWFSSSSLLPRAVLYTPPSLPSQINKSNPSDHLPLKASFSFIDPGVAKSENTFDLANRPAPMIDPVAASVQNHMKKESSASSSGSLRRKEIQSKIQSTDAARRPIPTFFDRKKLKQLNRRTDADDEVVSASAPVSKRKDAEPPLPGRSR